MVEELACQSLARACAAAIVVDAAVPRPGLSSFQRPRRDLDPLGFAGLAPLAYEACLCSCLGALHGSASDWVECWLSSVEAMVTSWGNPGLGSLFLLSLQAAALGQSLRRGRGDSVEAIMASSRIVVDESGVEAAVAFYRGLQLVSPGYLARISWSGLPEVDGRHSLEMLREAGVTLRALLEAASLYDPVSRDAVSFMALSLGMALPILRGEDCLERGVRRATYTLAGLEGDLLVSRKAGSICSELWLKAAEGDRRAEMELWRVLESAGPGSVADVVVNAVARLLYEYLHGSMLAPRLFCHA